MSRSALIAAAAWGWGAYGLAAAAAQDSVSMFEAYCLETGARSDQALAAADAAGWERFPADRLAELAQLIVVEAADGRLLRTASGPLVLVTGRTPNEGDGLVGEHCNVLRFGPPDAPDAEDRIGAWVGLPATRKEGRSEWQYEDRGSGRVALDPNDRRPLAQSFGIVTLTAPSVTRHELSRLDQVR